MPFRVLHVAPCGQVPNLSLPRRLAATRVNLRSMFDHGLARMAANFVVGIEWGQAGSLCHGERPGSVGFLG